MSAELAARVPARDILQVAGKALGSWLKKSHSLEKSIVDKLE